MPKEDKIYTYEDYITWNEDERWEIIDGIPYLQAAPTSEHQLISGELFGQLYNYFKGKSCKVFAAPYDICLEGNEKSKNVVQPDISVVCDKDKIKKTGYFGVPTIIIEILSPSTSRKDRIIKLNKYKECKVPIYWIVDPIYKIIETFTLKDGVYETNAYSKEDIKIEISLFEGLKIEIEDIFPDIE